MGDALSGSGTEFDLTPGVSIVDDIIFTPRHASSKLKSHEKPAELDVSVKSLQLLGNNEEGTPISAARSKSLLNLPLSWVTNHVQIKEKGCIPININAFFPCMQRLIIILLNASSCHAHHPIEHHDTFHLPNVNSIHPTDYDPLYVAGWHDLDLFRYRMLVRYRNQLWGGYRGVLCCRRMASSNPTSQDHHPWMTMGLN